MATLKGNKTRVLSARKKLRLFQFAVLKSAKTALAAETITANQYATIQTLYERPWRTTTATGVVVDVMDLVRADMVTSKGTAVADWYLQLAWLAHSTRMTTLLASIVSNTPA